MPKTKWESTKNGFINSFNSGGISYCGYSHSGGLNGDYPTTSASDSNGMGPGKHFYMRYEPGKEIKFYNDEGTINMHKSLEGVTEEHYMFMVVYHP